MMSDDASKVAWGVNVQSRRSGARASGPSGGSLAYCQRPSGDVEGLDATKSLLGINNAEKTAPISAMMPLTMSRSFSAPVVRRSDASVKE